jgi:hypothetical protein
MIEKKEFKKAINTPFEKARFIKKGQSWYLNGEDTIVVINLQKCDWKNLYFINFGIWIKALGDELFPEYNYTHINGRIERVFPKDRELILTSCDLEKTNSELLADLSYLLEHQIIPFLHDCTDNSKLRSFIKNGFLKGCFIGIGPDWYLSSQ